jgi:hypothetical protein
MKIKRLPAGFVITKSSTGCRLIVRRDRRTVRLDTRNAYDWTLRLPAIWRYCPADQNQDLRDRRRGGCARA